jgi:hypothetical protein
MRGMGHDPCTHYVQIDVRHAPRKVSVRLDGRRVVPVFPVSAFPALALVVFLGGPTCDELKALRNDIRGRVLYQQVHAIARDYEVENAQAVALPCLEQPVAIAIPIAGRTREGTPADGIGG